MTSDALSFSMAMHDAGFCKLTEMLIVFQSLDSVYDASKEMNAGYMHLPSSL